MIFSHRMVYLQRLTHANTHQETSDEELWPTLRQSATNRRDNAEDRSDEDSTTTAEVEVHGIREPTSNERGTKVRSSIYDSDEPAVADLVWIALVFAMPDSELCRETQVGSI